MEVVGVLCFAAVEQAEHSISLPKCWVEHWY